MKHRPDNPEGVEELRQLAAEQETNLKELSKADEELRLMAEGERIEWCRRSPSLKRDITIYPETLTPDQG